MKFISVARCEGVGGEINSPAALILLLLPEFLLKLLDREIFLCLVHPFLPFRLVAFGLLRSTVFRGRFVVSSFVATIFLVETNIVGVFWSFQPFPDVLPAEEEGREIGIASAIWSG